MARQIKVKDRPENKRNEKVIARRKPKAEGPKEYWWNLQEDHHEAVFSVIRHLDMHQGARQQLNAYYEMLYGMSPGLSYASGLTALDLGLPVDRLQLNVIKSVINAKKARIAKNQGRTRFLVSGGDYAQRERGIMLEKYCAGLGYANRNHVKAREMYRHANVTGTGFVKVFEEDNKVCTEHVPGNEMMVDEEETQHGETFQLYQRKAVSRRVVLDWYGEIFGEEAVANAPRVSRQTGEHAGISDMIWLVEAWHLPTDSQNTNGRHVWAIETASHAEDWQDKRFPFAVFRPEVAMRGYHGEGAAERLEPVQVELNKLLHTGHLSMHLCSVPHYLVDDESEILDSHIDNDIGTIIRYNGRPPQKEVSNSVPAEIWQRVERMYQLAYELEGISQMTAVGRKEPGVDAAVAMRERADIESERFSSEAQDFEQAKVDIDELSIACARRIAAKNGGKYKVQALDGNSFRSLEWSQVSLEDDEFIMQPYPASSLPHTPEGRAQWIEERMASGLIDLATGRMLMQMPDIEDKLNEANAPRRDIEKTIHHMLHADPANGDVDNVYLPPEPFQDIALGYPIVAHAYLNGRLEKVPEERLELLRRWLEDAEPLLPKPPAPPMPGGAMPMGGPPPMAGAPV